MKIEKTFSGFCNLDEGIDVVQVCDPDRLGRATTEGEQRYVAGYIIKHILCKKIYEDNRLSNIMQKVVPEKLK